MAQKVKVLDVRRLPSMQPGRLGKHDRLVTFQVEGGGGDTVTVPDEQFDDEHVQAAIADALKERGAWIGRELEV